jgi:hypothetical protein
MDMLSMAIMGIVCTILICVGIAVVRSGGLSNMIGGH